MEALLLLTIGLPAAVAAALLVCGLLLGLAGLPALPESVWRGIGLVASIATFAITLLVVVPAFDPEQLGLQLVESVHLAGSAEVHLLFGLDGIGLCFMLSTAGLVPLAMLSVRGGTIESVRAWVLVCLCLETALLGALAAASWLAFLLCWSLGLVPILVWFGCWGGEGRTRAAARLWTVEAIGLAGLLFVAFVLREACRVQLGVPTLDLVSLDPAGGATLLDVRIEPDEQRFLLAALGIALATRLPIVPFHFWTPTAHAAAPVGLSMLLATGFVQTAAIGALRFALPLFPDAATEAGPLLAAIGIISLAYASLVALVQKELTRLVAYASAAYAGFALFGISTLNVQGVTGAVVQLLTHGLATAGLFVLIGFLARRRETTEVAAFGGLAKPMPVCAFFFGVMVLSLMGLPLLGGFVGDLFVLLGSLERSRELSIVALIAMVVAASYLLWVQRRIFLGPVDEPANRGLIDLDRLERGILLVLTIPIVAIGVYPNPVLRRVEPSVLEILYQMERRAIGVEEPDPESAEASEAEVVRSDPFTGESRS